MTAKTRKKSTETKPAETYPRKHIPCRAVAEEGDLDAMGKAYAQVMTAPEVAALRVVQVANPDNLVEQLDTIGMLAVLREQSAAINKGDLSNVEAMLANQAVALQSLFTRLTERAMLQERMPNLEGFMRLALRAQSQCRATLETLATIKNPPVVIAKQANVTSGPQQINNGTPAPAHVRDVEPEQNKLLEATNGERLDTGAASAAIGADPQLATLATLDRAKVG